MGVKVPAIPHRSLIAKEMLCAPRYDVCLTGRHLVAAHRTPVGFFSTVRRNISDIPVNAATSFLSCPSVGEPRHITR